MKMKNLASIVNYGTKEQESVTINGTEELESEVFNEPKEPPL